MAIDPDFNKVTELFSNRLMVAVGWRHNYFGAAYSTRLKAAIKDLKTAIAEAEKCIELKPD